MLNADFYGTPGTPEHTIFQSQYWSMIRTKRDELLTASDYTQMPDSPLTTEQKQSWADYRQALRDLPGSNDDPALVVWPTPPQEQ
ncbi:tail fiber assembly protein [Pseudoalteromonas piscicida]|uniref:tail fiber assembly protein n=1 Tax=Pseudoalteromonas piscicida TaxID=43662 RepID=UPI0030C96821